jgi:hypothetical protein
MRIGFILPLKNKLKKKFKSLPYGHFPDSCYELRKTTLLPFVGPSFFEAQSLRPAAPPCWQGFF